MRLTSMWMWSLCTLGALAAAACGEDDATTTTDPSTTSTTSTGGTGGTAGASTSTTSSGGMAGMGGTGGVGGSGGAGGGATGSQSAYYWGDFDTDQVAEIARISYPDGMPSKIVPMGVTTIDETYDIAVSPDGNQIAVALRVDGGHAQIVLLAPDGSGTPLQVADWSSSPTSINDPTDVGIRSVVWSPNGARLAFVSDYEENGRTRAYVVPTDGSATTPKLVSQDPNNTEQDAFDVAWIDGSNVAYQGDLETDGVSNMFASDVTLGTPAPVALVPSGMLSGGAEVESGAQVDAGGKIYFRSTHTDGKFYLYRVDADGSNLEQFAPAAALMKTIEQAEVGRFAVSPDGLEVAFSADAPVADFYQVYLAGTGDTTATQLTNLTPTPGSVLGPVGSTFQPPAIEWSPDQSMLAVVADWPGDVNDVNNDFTGWIVPTVGTGATRIATVATVDDNSDVDRMVFSTDGARVFIRGDLIDNNDTEVYSTDDLSTADQDLMSILVEDVPAGGDVTGLTIAP